LFGLRMPQLASVEPLRIARTAETPPVPAEVLWE
jgi:hypothetical protein